MPCGPRRWQMRIPLPRDPATGRAHVHYRTVGPARKDAQAYIDWYVGLVAGGNTPLDIITQSELRNLAAIERKAFDSRAKLLARVNAGAKVQPGPLSL